MNEPNNIAAFESHRTVKRWRGLQADHVCNGF